MPLVTSLSAYADSRQIQEEEEDEERRRHEAVRLPGDFKQNGAVKESVLFLRVGSAADYFTSNATLMLNVPPVDMDISECPPLIEASENDF